MNCSLVLPFYSFPERKGGLPPPMRLGGSEAGHYVVYHSAEDFLLSSVIH